MYPQRELARLAAYKVALRQDIHRHRVQCATAAGRIAQPFDLLDRMLVLWRRILPLAPFAALPLGLLLRRTRFPGLKVIRLLLRWGPVAFTTFRGIRSLRTIRSKFTENRRS